MRYRPLGKSGLIVSEIGFGAWGIGGRTPGLTSYGDTNDAVSRNALAAAFDAGITLYDTAPAYGDGHSETLIGEVFCGRRDRVCLATKAGLASFATAADFSPAALRDSVASSLRRLKTDYVDVLQLHNPAPTLGDEWSEIVATLEELRSDGMIRAYGVSAKRPADAMAIARWLQPAAFQINFNMLDWRARDDGLLDAAETKGIGLIARTPLCFGFLAGAGGQDADGFPPGDHRTAWTVEQRRRWREAAASLEQALAQPPAVPLSVQALRFCLSFDAVTTVLPGMLMPEEVTSNVRASALGPLTSAEVRLTQAIGNRETSLSPSGNP